MGTKIKVIDSKDVPWPVNLLARIPTVSAEPTAVLKRTEIQNLTIKTGGCKVIDVKDSSQSAQLLIIAEPGVFECLKKIDCRPYYGLERINIKILLKTKVTRVDREPDWSLEKVKETTGG